LIPKDLKRRALFEQAASIEQSNFHPHVKSVTHEALVKGYNRVLFIGFKYHANNKRLTGLLDKSLI
jgi:hypothetical protein